ncbi:MAG: sensor histidine kinase, partial [Acidimicrobiales bacterium]
MKSADTPTLVLQRVVLPAVLAFAQVAGTLAAQNDQPDRDPVDALAIGLLLAGPAAFVVLRRHVVALAATVMAVTLVYVAAGYPYGPIFISVAVSLFLVVREGKRMEAWAIAGVGFVAAVATHVWFDHDPHQTWVHAAAVAGWLIAVLVVADIVRVRAERLRETARRQTSEERLR